jgi:hypothetical protein
MPLPTGSYSASGGDAASQNGNVDFSAGGNEFGGLNYNTGISPVLILVAVALTFWIAKNV